MQAVSLAFFEYATLRASSQFRPFFVGTEKTAITQLCWSDFFQPKPRARQKTKSKKTRAFRRGHE
jgi:hypothetical protein